MEDKISRLNLTISSILYPRVTKLLDALPSRLRAAKLLYYAELNLMADENGRGLYANHKVPENLSQ